MKKHVALYGLAGGLLIGLLRLVEYRYLVLQHSIELYGAAIAALFVSLGVWFGLRLNPGRRTSAAAADVPSPAPSPPSATVMPVVADAAPLPASEAPGVTPREREILALMAAGLTNREIATTLYVSENTVKTHSSRLFEKLGAKRRTQAVQIGRQRGLIA